MPQSLQAVNHKNQLAEWSQHAEACRSSGLSVAQWCKEAGIPKSTYYGWQRKVFDAISQEVCFAEVSVAPDQPVPSRTIAAISVNNSRIEVYPGADRTTLQAILEAVKQC